MSMLSPDEVKGDVARSTQPLSASCGDSQFPAIPVLRTGPLAGGSRPQPPLGDVARSTQPVSASCGDSQFPAIPVLRTGPLAGGSRRHFIVAGAAAFVASSLPSSEACAQAGSPSAGLAEVTGT